MLKTIEATGRTEEDAISSALEQAGRTRDEVSVEILERAKSGFFGFGGSAAKVSISWEEKDSKLIELEKFLNGLFERMDIAADIKTIENSEAGVISVELSGSKVGALIGHRGETLDAIQHLANYVVNKGDSDRTRINIDAENYRAKRSDALNNLAKKVAVKVVKYHRSVTLESMNAYERHIIHTALQDFENVTTYSTGTEPNRRVVVAYDRPQGESRQAGTHPPRERSYSRPHSDSKPQKAEASPAKEKEQAKYTAREWH